MVSFQQLCKLLPQDQACLAVMHAIDRLNATGADEATVQGVKLFAFSAECWPSSTLQLLAPALLRHWTLHRDFSVREVSALNCCYTATQQHPATDKNASQEQHCCQGWCGKLQPGLSGKHTYACTFLQADDHAELMLILLLLLLLLLQALACCLSLIAGSLPLRAWVEAVLPCLQQLCKDSNWRVRRACAADLPRLADKLNEKQQGMRQLSSDEDDISSHSGGSWYGASEDGSSSSSGSTTSSYSSSSVASLSYNCSMGPSRGSSPQPPRARAQHPMASSLIPADAPLHATHHNKQQPPVDIEDRKPAFDQNGVANNSVPKQEHTGCSIKQLFELANAQASEGTAPTAAATDSSSESDSDVNSSRTNVSKLLNNCWSRVRECLEVLTCDTSHWVKVSALSGLGGVLVVLPLYHISLTLLTRFTSMASSSVVIYDISVALSCAQSFEAVLLKLGASRWPDLR